MIRILLASLLLCGLAACSARTCTLEGEYLQAREYPALKNPDGGELPPRDPAYQLPPVPQQEYKSSRSYIDEQGDTQSDCLDRPPHLIQKQS